MRTLRNATARGGARREQQVQDREIATLRAMVAGLQPREIVVENDVEVVKEVVVPPGWYARWCVRCRCRWRWCGRWCAPSGWRCPSRPGGAGGDPAGRGTGIQGRARARAQVRGDVAGAHRAARAAGATVANLPVGERPAWGAGPGRRARQATRLAPRLAASLAAARLAAASPPADSLPSSPPPPAAAVAAAVASGRPTRLLPTGPKARRRRRRRRAATRAASTLLDAAASTADERTRRAAAQRRRGARACGRRGAEPTRSARRAADGSRRRGAQRGGRCGAALQLVEVEVEAYLRHETTLDAARKREARLHGILKKVAAEATPLHRHFAQRDAARRAADAAAGERARDDAMREAFAAQGRQVAAAAEAGWRHTRHAAPRRVHQGGRRGRGALTAASASAAATTSASSTRRRRRRRPEDDLFEREVRTRGRATTDDPRIATQRADAVAARDGEPRAGQQARAQDGRARPGESVASSSRPSSAT